MECAKETVHDAKLGGIDQIKGGKVIAVFSRANGPHTNLMQLFTAYWDANRPDELDALGLAGCAAGGVGNLACGGTRSDTLPQLVDARSTATVSHLKFSTRGWASQAGHHHCSRHNQHTRRPALIADKIQFKQNPTIAQTIHVQNSIA